MHEKPTLMRQREGCAGGGKGPLMSEDKSLTLAANANDQVLFVPETTHTLKAEAHDASEDGTGRGVPLIPCGIDVGEVGYSLRANPSRSGDKGDGGVNCTLAVAFTIHGTDKTASVASSAEVAGAIRTKPPGSVENSSTTVALSGMAVRRLTPRECERLQGFPDDYTRIPWRGKPAEDCPDGPRYKALGNSMAVPAMHWIGKRIAQVEEIIR